MLRTTTLYDVKNLFNRHIYPASAERRKMSLYLGTSCGQGRQDEDRDEGLDAESLMDDASDSEPGSISTR